MNCPHEYMIPDGERPYYRCTQCRERFKKVDPGRNEVMYTSAPE